MKTNSDAITLNVSGSDHERVRKVFSETRARILAEHAAFLAQSGWELRV
jgi:hypothetical protein